MKIWLRIAALLIFFQFFATLVYASSNIEIELVGIASHIVDGDTFDLTVANGTEYRIRLADLNASEIGQVGYTEAKNYLSGLVYGKTVYSDVDDFYIWDAGGNGNRLVCVCYVDYNSTHLITVNEALIQTGHAQIKHYDNEFNPYTWSLYTSKEETIPEFPTIILPAAAAAAVLLLAAAHSKLKKL